MSRIQRPGPAPIVQGPESSVQFLRVESRNSGMPNKFRNHFNFKFEFVSTDIILRHRKEIDIKKSSSGEISPAVIKGTLMQI